MTENFDLTNVTNACLAEDKAIAAGESRETLILKAAYKAAETINDIYCSGHAVVLCGPGNNGKDGLYTAFFLQLSGWKISVISVYWAEQQHDDNFLLSKKLLIHHTPFARMPIDGNLFKDRPIIVDAIFGIGLNKTVSDDLMQFMEKIEKTNLPIISIDMPTGVHADNGEIMGKAFKAAHTITFTKAKIGQFLLPGRNYMGQLTTIDIGIGKYWDNSLNLFLNDPSIWKGLIPFTRPEQHKYHHGTAFIIAGPMTGAAKLAARAAMRSGAGILKIICTPEKKLVYEIDDPENIILEIKSHQNIHEIIAANQNLCGQSLLIGSGFNSNITNQQLVLDSLNCQIPIVIDGGGISCFAENPALLLKNLAKNAVLTPHEGEFRKLFPHLTGDKLLKTKKAAQESQAIIVHKGADTVIAEPGGRTIIHSHSPPNLATAGTGDVLAGIITGLMAQQVPNFEAACIGVWLQTNCAERFGVGLIASDIIKEIPRSLGILQSLLKN